MERKLSDALEIITKLGIAKKKHIVLHLDVIDDSEFCYVTGELLKHGFIEPVQDETDAFKITAYGLSWVTYIDSDKGYIQDEVCDAAITILKYMNLPDNSSKSFYDICSEFSIDDDIIMEAVELLENIGYLSADDEDADLESKTFEISDGMSGYIDYLLSI